MAKIKEGLSDPINTFNLNGLDYPKNRYEIYYRNILSDDSGDVVTDLVQVGIRSIANTSNVIQSPILFSNWLNDSDVAYTDLNTLVGDLTVFVGFKNPQVSGNALKGSTGWVFIGDTQYTEASPLSINSGELNKVTVPNNAGIFLDFVGLDNSTTIWDSVNSKIQPNNLWDEYDVRVQCVANPAVNNRNFTIELDIGGLTEDIIWKKTVRLSRGTAVDTDVTELMDLFTGANFINNGGKIKFWCDGDVSIHDIRFKISRKFKFIP